MVKLSETQEKILNLLKIQDAKLLASRGEWSEDTIAQHCHKIRKKYKEARTFVNRIDSMRTQYPNLRKYLKTRETS